MVFDPLDIKPLLSLAPSPVSMVTEGITWEILTFNPDKDTVPYEAILVKPRPSSAPPPLAVFPHGIELIMTS